jgi:hypothetical protein
MTVFGWTKLDVKSGNADSDSTERTSMSIGRGRGGYHVRNMGSALTHAYPVHGKASFRPSGDPLKDDPEIPREDVHSTAGLNLPKTRAEQEREDRASIKRYPGFALWLPEYAYWDNIRFRNEKPATNSRKKSRKIKRAMELLDSE